MNKKNYSAVPYTKTFNISKRKIFKCDCSNDLNLKMTRTVLSLCIC